MNRALLFTAALIAAALFHLIGVRVVAEWSLILDLMLIVVVFNALDGNTLAGMIGGLVAGWTTDVLVGPAFGIFGLVDTVIGYGAAYAAQRIVIQRPAGTALFFALVVACQQSLVLVLSLLLLNDPQIPAFHWLLMKAGSTGLVGAVVLYLRNRFTSQVDLWRHTRPTRIRLEK